MIFVYTVNRIFRQYLQFAKTDRHVIDTLTNLQKPKQKNAKNRRHETNLQHLNIVKKIYYTRYFLTKCIGFGGHRPKQFQNR